MPTRLIFSNHKIRTDGIPLEILSNETKSSTDILNMRQLWNHSTETMHPRSTQMLNLMKYFKTKPHHFNYGSIENEEFKQWTQEITKIASHSWSRRTSFNCSKAVGTATGTQDIFLNLRMDCRTSLSSSWLGPELLLPQMPVCRLTSRSR